jgi:hypothetical protein
MSDSGITELALERIGQYNDCLASLHTTGDPDERYQILHTMGYWADAIAEACTGDKQVKWLQQSALIKGVAETEAGCVPDQGLTDLYPPGLASTAWAGLACARPNHRLRADWLHELFAALDEPRQMPLAALMVLDDIAASELTAAALEPQS